MKQKALAHEFLFASANRTLKATWLSFSHLVVFRVVKDVSYYTVLLKIPALGVVTTSILPSGIGAPKAVEGNNLAFNLRKIYLPS